MAHYQSYPTGDHEFSNLVYNIMVEKHDYTYADLEATNDSLTLVIPAGRIILGVAHEVTTAFAGGTPALDIGDGSDADYWIAAASVTLGTVGNFYYSGGSAAAGAGGRKYNSAGLLVVDHADGLTAGAGSVYVFFVDPADNWRLP